MVRFTNHKLFNFSNISFIYIKKSLTCTFWSAIDEKHLNSLKDNTGKKSLKTPLLQLDLRRQQQPITTGVAGANGVCCHKVVVPRPLNEKLKLTCARVESYSRACRIAARARADRLRVGKLLVLEGFVIPLASVYLRAQSWFLCSTVGFAISAGFFFTCKLCHCARAAVICMRPGFTRLQTFVHLLTSYWDKINQQNI